MVGTTGTPTGVTGTTGTPTGVTGTTGTPTGVTGTASTPTGVTGTASMPTSGATSPGRINSSLLCYAIAAYAYRYAYEETTNAIISSASGNGIFTAIPIEVLEALKKEENAENVKKGKKILDTPEMAEAEKELRILCADPEVQAREGKTEEDLLALAGLSPVEPPTP